MASTVSMDFESIKNRVLKNLSSMSEWASFTSFGAIDNLVSAFASEMAYEIQYGEYNALENFWNKARNKSSLLTMSPMHGYIVPRKMGAQGTLRISTDEEFSQQHSCNVTIPKYTQFSGNGLSVVTLSQNTLSSSSKYIDVECIEGVYKTITFSALGNIYEEKIIKDENVDNDVFVLYVNGIEWTCVDSLFDYDGDEMVYCIKSLPDLSGVKLCFGNNYFGKQLTANDNVSFSYLSTNGYDGNIYSKELIDTCDSVIYDANGDETTIYCSNITSIVGGKNYPTLEEIRELSPKVYQSGDRATSTEDYQTLIKQNSFISKCLVWGIYDTIVNENDNIWEYVASEDNVIHVACLNTSDNELTDGQKETIRSQIYKKCDPTDFIKFESVNKVPLTFTVNAVIKNTSYNLSTVKNSIENLLKETYSIKNLNFRDAIYYSDFISSLDSIDGIKYHNSSISLHLEDKLLTSNYVGTFKLPIYPIDTDNSYIYVKHNNDDYELMATFDDEGNINGVNTYNTNGSFLNLSTGVGSLIINSGLIYSYDTYTFKIVYCGKSQNLILTEGTDIFYYYDSDITLEYSL